MKASLFIIETVDDDGNLVTHISSTKTDAMSAARGLSLVHKKVNARYTKYEFSGKPKDVVAAAAAAVVTGIFTVGYSADCSTRDVEKFQFKNGKKVRVKPPADAPLLGDNPA